MTEPLSAVDIRFHFIGGVTGNFNGIFVGEAGGRDAQRAPGGRGGETKKAAAPFDAAAHVGMVNPGGAYFAPKRK
ncbi:hypothetical protein KP001_13555 [Geomonas subterranea]|uniref:Uncharacterized protein n=1 Tax=Geomonas subterranea TaxID=2847989 RepID=A0ABX8LFN6_9BACT|nr:hypothetical protein [Geomonas subterranea]QXE89470.1 hypothetical protein KP001_13555 [Geomonas subterranea]